MRAILITAGAAALATAVQVAADNHDDYMLEILRAEVKMGHNMQFRDGVKAYTECYADAGGTMSWNVWYNMDGEGSIYYRVAPRENWAELDVRDEAADSCYAILSEQIAPHMDSSATMYVRSMPDWSEDEQPDDATVARVHNFSVDDDYKFRGAISAVTGIRKAIAPEELGTWYAVIGGSQEDPEYFVVQQYKNFAAMDEDTMGPYGTLKEHSGEATADLIWNEYRDSLEEGDAYWSELLRYDEELSYSVE